MGGRKIHVVVTARDIAKGEPGRDTRCPIALALHRCGFPRASVMFDLVLLDADVFGPDRTDVARTLPKSVSKKIEKYDDTGIMKPFSFTLGGASRKRTRG